MKFKHFLAVVVLFGAMGCQSASPPPTKLSVGAISFGEAEQSVQQYAELKTYLGRELHSLLELEPTYNEIKARQEIENKTWDLVFAPPGLAALAISQSQYIPLFPLTGVLKGRSLIVVRQDSSLATLSQLNGKVVALEQPGSATGYYLPIYNLYGLTLAEVRLAGTPRTVLQWIAEGKVAAGAISLEDFNRYRADFPGVQFRVLYTDTHPVPSGAVLVSSALDSRQQEQIRQALANAPSVIASSAGYIPNAPVPDYTYLLEVVKRVQPIAGRIQQKPAPLYEAK
jgi:phosphonate transport system substrate-binding protein